MPFDFCIFIHFFLFNFTFLHSWDVYLVVWFWLQTVNMAGCPSHMLMEENGCVMMIQAIISERAIEKGSEIQNREREREMWRIGGHSQAVLTPRGKTTAHRVRLTSARWSVRDSRAHFVQNKANWSQVREIQKGRDSFSCADHRPALSGCRTKRTSSVREQEPESLAGV